MDRLPKLPGGCKSLSDTVRVIDVNGNIHEPMTMAEAQTLASRQNAIMVRIATDKRRVHTFRFLDKNSKKRS